MIQKEQIMVLDINDGAMKKLVRKSTRGEALFGTLPSSAQDLVQDVAPEDWTHFITVTIFVRKTKPEDADIDMCVGFVCVRGGEFLVVEEGVTLRE